MSIAMAQSIDERIALHTEQLKTLDIRDYYQKQQELLKQIANNQLDPSALEELKSRTPSRAGTIITASSRASSPPDSPASRTSTSTATSRRRSNRESKLMLETSSSSSESKNEFDFLASQYSSADYTSVLPKGLVSTKKPKGANVSHSHRLQTTYTINEHGERVYEMSALPPDPRALLDDSNGLVKTNSTEDEKIIFR